MEWPLSPITAPLHRPQAERGSVRNGIEQGLVEGQAFNAALIDPLLERSFRRSELLSKGRNSPLAGQTLKGAVSAVFIEGHQVF